MKKRQIILDFTSLLDVIMIILFFFIIFSNLETDNLRKDLEDKGLVISGVSPDDFLVEIVELPNHPWAVGCQFHPEFKSRPNRPHPLFKSFLEAIYEYSKN